MNKMALCVFCGSQLGADPAYEAAAKALAKGMAERHWSLVYGGGDAGLMGVVANACIEEGCEVLGVIPQFLDETEIIHPDLDELVIVDSMAERKQIMEERCDAFCILPGGFGTLDEMFEFIALSQLKQHDKPVILLNINGYYDFLLKQIDVMIDQGFIKQKYRQLIIEADRPEDLFQYFS